MSKVPSIKKVVSVSVRAEKLPSYPQYDMDKYPHIKLFHFELAIQWVLDVRLKKVLGEKYQELDDADEALADVKKFNKAVDLGLFNDFENVINKIYENRRNDYE